MLWITSSKQHRCSDKGKQYLVTHVMIATIQLPSSTFQWAIDDNNGSYTFIPRLTQAYIYTYAP